MKSLNELKEQELLVGARFADAATIFATACSRFVDLLERLEKRFSDKIGEQIGEKPSRGKHVS